MIRSVVIAAMLLAAVPAAAQNAPAGSVLVREAWSRATPGGAKVGAGYLTVENRGAADRFLGAEAEVAGKVELHETVMADGVARMRPTEALVLAPAGKVELKPGGYHLMLMDLKRPLKEGERFAGTLLFEKAGRVPVTFEVRGMGAGAGAHHHH